MNFHWIHDEDDLLEVFGSWRALAEAARNPYALSEWMLAWWRHAAPAGAELSVLVLREQEDIVAIGPFFVDRRFGLNRLRMLGAGVSSSPSVLARAGSHAVLARTLVDELSSGRIADSIMLEGVPAHDPWRLQLLGETAAGHSLLPTPGWEQPSPHLRIDQFGYDEWFKQKGSKFRSRIRRGERQLAALHGRHVLAINEADVRRGLEEFERLHEQRWAERGGSGVLTAGVRAMLRDFAGIAPQHLRIWTTEVEGRPLSVQVFLVAGGTVSHWLGGLDDAGPTLHPGAGVLGLHRAIKHSWQQGDQLFDFGAGGQALKYRFADGESTLTYGSFVRNRWSVLPAMIPNLPAVLRAHVSPRVPDGAKKRARAFATRLRRQIK
jgi:CelD/BcsL family acetyltransferase involved in cellulose biosynthesis